MGLLRGESFHCFENRPMRSDCRARVMYAWSSREVLSNGEFDAVSRSSARVWGDRPLIDSRYQGHLGCTRKEGVK